MKDLQQKQSNIYLDDTIETIKFQKQALEVKFKHNINELTRKNIQLGLMLKNVLGKEQANIKVECELFKKTVDACISIQDALTSLDVLQKKTEILKLQVNDVRDRLCQVEAVSPQKSV